MRCIMKKQNEDRIAIVAGYRTPFCKAGGVFSDFEADDLGAYVVRELVMRSGVPLESIDELIFGNVITPFGASNIARIIGVKGGLPLKVPAFTVNRNCASGLEAITTAAERISSGHDDIVIAGGIESMTNFPVVISKRYKKFLIQLAKAKGFQKVSTWLSFRPSFLVPHFPEIADPLCGLSMGQTAENLAREFHITREAQDKFALRSQQRAEAAIANGTMAEEIVPIPYPPAFNAIQSQDEGPRAGQTLEALAKLKTSFDSLTGTVTAGNSSPLTDGASALILMKESKAKELELTPMGYLRDFAAAALQPSRMGLGPVFAAAKLLQKTGMTLNSVDLIEINEAFAAQVLACLKAFESNEFAKKELHLDRAVGSVEMDKLNVNGGAIALGHPLGASGARLVLTILKELKRKKKNIGLVALCIGGGQGQAAIVEVE